MTGNKADYYYKKNLEDIIENGYFDENPRPKWKDGTPAHSKFITQVFERYDLSKNEFPITTLRNTAIKTGIKEILWIYQGQNSSLKDAHDRGINWWDEWDIGDGTIGQRYGATIAKHDLMNKLLDSLKNDPFSRRHIISLYQYEDMCATNGLHPCAYETLWSVRKDEEGHMVLDMTLVQRSNDYVMAGYINKIQYVALQMMVASHLGYKIGTFCHYVHNLHIYDRHMNAAKTLLTRPSLILNDPRINLKTNKSFYEFTIDDFEISGVSDIPKLEDKLEIAV